MVTKLKKQDLRDKIANVRLPALMFDAIDAERARRAARGGTPRALRSTFLRHLIAEALRASGHAIPEE